MTYTLIARHEVKDYDTWKQMFDGSGGSADFKSMAGIIASSLYRDLDNPNVVTVRHQFADAGKARAFLARLDSDEFRNGDPVKKMGVIVETMVAMVMQDVE